MEQRPNYVTDGYDDYEMFKDAGLIEDDDSEKCWVSDWWIEENVD
jgi:hypothetical protein